MMNGQAKQADRERLERIAKGTGQSLGELHEAMDRRTYKPVHEPKLYRENTGQHYPGFADREPAAAPVEAGPVRIAKPKKVNTAGKTISEDAYKAELAAQAKRAQALAYLSQTQDGIPDDCLRGAAAARRARDNKSALSRDNTLKLVAEREADTKFKTLQSKLLSVQQRLRDAGGSFKNLQGGTGASPAVAATAVPPQQPSLVAAGPLPPGWTAKLHPSTRQTYYVRDDTGEKRWSPPGAADDDAAGGSTMGPAMPPGLLATARGTGPGGNNKNKGGASSSSSSKRKRDVDPLDPGGPSGKWADGLHHKGERMADSTAAGPLWQQRPLPAPSEVLRMRGPGVHEGRSIGPAFPSPRPGAPGPPPPPPPRQPSTSRPAAFAFVPRQAAQQRNKLPRPGQ